MSHNIINKQTQSFFSLAFKVLYTMKNLVKYQPTALFCNNKPVYLYVSLSLRSDVISSSL